MDKKVFDALNRMDDLDLKCEVVAALAYTTWDSFENGSFKCEIEDYAPMLLLMHLKTLEVKKSFKEALEQLHDSLEEVKQYK